MNDTYAYEKTKQDMVHPAFSIFIIKGLIIVECQYTPQQNIEHHKKMKKVEPFQMVGDFL